MSKNVGGVDKTLRFVVAIGAALAGALAPIGEGLRIAAFVVAGVALFTAIFGF